VNIISASLQAPFLGLIAELQEKTLIELANAGKLADPQVLLINNEKQLSQYFAEVIVLCQRSTRLVYKYNRNTLSYFSKQHPLSMLEKKSRKQKQKGKQLQSPITPANTGSAKLNTNVQAYVKLISESQAALINLARARRNFFSSRKQLSPDSVTQPLQ
jgi:hypothetical protein